MQLAASDPDIATLYRKISEGRLDLQPNFQRGEVWGKPKKQRLIDSILRGWHIPPIHVIHVPDSKKQEVLDGQQRLAAIRDFIEGKFAINGSLDPVESYISELNGLTWGDLPEDIQSKIEDFTIRILTISNYKPGEPGELFYRLNQPTNLTSAEQRNAYFGEARKQVKSLSEMMTNLGFDREILGFSNSRMAYDDVVSKFLLTLELKTLKKKITANTVTSRYRDLDGFPTSLVEEAEVSLRVLYKCLKQSEVAFKLNKASALSWLIFIHSYLCRFDDTDFLTEYFEVFELLRNDPHKLALIANDLSGLDGNTLKKILDIYQDRSSSRVADTSSVVLRDLALWSIFTILNPQAQRENLLSLEHSIFSLEEKIALTGSTEKALEAVANELNWGGEIC